MSDGTPHSPGAHQPDDQPGHSGTFFDILCGFALLLFLYILGIGPACKIAERYPATRPFLAATYVPFKKAYDACPPIRRSVDWYVESVWKVKDH